MSDTATMPKLAEGCFCGECDPSCQYAPFRPCCGACMVGGAYDPDGELLAAARAQHESIPQCAERIAHDHNIPLREALRVAYAESRLEARKAARARMSSLPEEE